MSFAGFPFLLAAALSAGNAEFDDAARHGAAEIAISRERAAVIAAGPKNLDLKRVMLAAPEDYAEPTNAATRCRDLYADAAAKTFDEGVARIRARLQLPDVEAAFTPKDRTAALGTFSNAFAVARKAACEEQARSIVLNVRPSVVELDADDEAAAAKKMSERIAASQKTAVFDENREYISERIVKPVIDASKKEKRRQEDYVRRVRSDACAPSVLANDLSRKLVANVVDRAAHASDPVQRWEVFPSVTNRTVAAAVRHRTVERLATSVSGVAFAPTELEIAGVLSADRTVHRVAADSERAFRTGYGAKLLAAALADAVGAAPETERAEFKEALEGHLTDRTVVKASDARMEASLVPAWRAARRQAVEADFAARWPTLADRTWFPDADTADETCARSDYAQTVAAWRQIPALNALDRGEDAFEEASAKADQSVRAGFELARGAIAAQVKIVDGLHDGVLSESRRRKDSFFTRTPDLKAIVAMLTEATEREWGASREKTLWGDGEKPANAAEQHAALFPSVRRRIELVAKTILEEMKKPEPEPQPEKKPEEPPPPEETPPEDSPEEPPEELMLFTITVEHGADGVEVKLEQGKKTLVERHARPEMSDFSDAMKQLSDKLGREILKLK